MGKPYSLDLRDRIIDYVIQGHSARAAGRVYGVSASTAIRLVSAWRQHGDVAPKPQGRPAGKVGKLAPHLGYLTGLVVSNPDMTLEELAAALEASKGLKVHPSSIHRALDRAGYSYKKRAGGPGA